MDPPTLPGDVDIGGGGDWNRLSWNKFPLLVHFHVFGFLDRKSLNCMRLASKDVQDEIDYHFGLHLILPPRGAWRRDDHWGPLGHCGINHIITNEMLSNIVFGMEGKLIHTLTMVEVPPAYNPFPFEQIEYPERIKRIHLKFVDIRLILDILANCRTVSHLSYETSKCPRSVLTFQTIINDVPIPRTRQQFLDAIAEYPVPAYPLKFRNLTKLQLSLRFDNYDFGQSDWANVLYILLALPTANNLTNFAFEMDYNDLFETEEYHLFIVACIADALVRFPNLSQFKYRGASSPVFVRGDLAHVNNIFNALTRRFGSSQLKEFIQVRTHPHQRLREINKIMEKAGESLKNLREFELKIGRILDINCFLGMVKHLTNLSTCRIIVSRPQSDEERPLRNQALLNFLHPEYGNEPVYKFVRKLHLTRDGAISYAKWRKLPSINLNKLLNSFQKLDHLEINQNRPLTHMDVEEWNAQELEGLEIGQGEDEDVVLIREISTQIHHDYPEVTIQFLQEVSTDRANFQQLQVLSLNSVKILARHMESLLHFCNLRQLWLVTARGYRHNRFGVPVDILFKIMSKLRFLNELRAGILIFPEDNDLHMGYLEALEELGSVANETFLFQP